MSMKITLCLAGVPVEAELSFGDYLPLYKNYITDKKPVASVRITREELERARPVYQENSSDSYVEHMELCTKISNILLEHDRVFFHGTAFVWRERAWILSAPPGTGKTTQYVLWKLLYGDEIQLLNGDKPVLELTGNGFTVHHSPWRGKENMGQELTAPLGGIILLEQGSENRIERLGREAVIPVFRQFLYEINSDSVKKVFELEDKLLRSIPVWRLYNLGDRASAMLCHDTLEEAIE